MPQRIHTSHLFQPLDEKLIELLSSLTAAEWEMQTVARLWTVKDVAAHLLDGNIRHLSMSRDNYFGETPGDIHSYEELVSFLNRLNADWVKAMKRMSPQVMVELLEITGRQFSRQIQSLNPDEPAMFSVAWAGEETSPNWFHVAREYTEKWHHQQQIRDAVGKQGIMTKEFYHPFLDTFMRALPHTFRNVSAPDDTVVKVTITGEGGGDWHVVKKDAWQLSDEALANEHAHTIIDGNAAWKLFSKSWRRQDVMQYVTITGDQPLGEVVLQMIAVMA